MDGESGHDVLVSDVGISKGPSYVTSSPDSPLSYKNPKRVELSLENLCENFSDMQSSCGGSLSGKSSDRDGREFNSLEASKEDKRKGVVGRNLISVEKKENIYANKKSFRITRTRSTDTISTLSSGKDMEPSVKLSSTSQISHKEYSSEKQARKTLMKKTPKMVSVKKPMNSLKGRKLAHGIDDPSEIGMDEFTFGCFLLKSSRDMISSGEDPCRALELAQRAEKLLKKDSNGNPSLDLVMCLHVIASILCHLDKYNEAIPVLKHSTEIADSIDHENRNVAKFTGFMELGDTYAMLGLIKNSIECYTKSLQIQISTLGETDPSVGQTCRYLAEAHVQALQFDEAKKMCQMALDIHKQSHHPASLEEAADRRLMGLICDTKGEHEAAIEHFVMASMAMVSNGQETEVASVDRSIGDAYLSLARYNEAVFAYRKALNLYKSSNGDNHPTVASIYVRLADLYNRTGKIREARSFCDSALLIYGNQVYDSPKEEVANVFMDISAIYQSMDETEQALMLLQKALKIYSDSPGQQIIIAGIEAQMGVIYYLMENFTCSYTFLQNAVEKLRKGGEKKIGIHGLALNQMGLVCAHLNKINEAVELFEEAKMVFEEEYGLYHPETLAVCSNLAGAYDALGRLEDAIRLLEYLVLIREEKLGTADPEVDDEKRRLAELLKEAGRVRIRKVTSLETLLHTTQTPENAIAKECI